MKKISNARAGLIMDQPFFGTLSLKLKVVEAPHRTETMSTNGIELIYNPKFVEELPLDQLKGVIVHEIMHCVLDHTSRRDYRDHDYWNCAADFAINPILLDAGFKLPDPLVDPAFRGMTAEQIYPIIAKKKKGNDDGKGDPDDGKGDSQKSKDNQPKSQKNQSKGNSQCQDPGGCGGVHDPVNKQGKILTKSEKDELSADWKIATAQAQQQAKAIGSMPAGLERFINELFETKVDWKAILREFIEKIAKNDYSWRFPNKRYAHLGMYLPSLFSEELGTIIIGVDTSGSVGKRELDQFASEITSVLHDFPKLEVEVVYCDTRVTNTENFRFEDLPLTLHAKGGGGTRFTPVFNWVKDNDIQPKCLIYFSDMWCHDFPDTPPEYPVLWARTQKGSNDHVPFGETIDVIIK